MYIVNFARLLDAIRLIESAPVSLYIQTLSEIEIKKVHKVPVPLK